MRVILLTDTYLNEVVGVYTLRRFIQEANQEYCEMYDIKHHFDLDNIEEAIDWYVDTAEGLAIDLMEVEVSKDDEV